MENNTNPPPKRVGCWTIGAGVLVVLFVLGEIGRLTSPTIAPTPAAAPATTPAASDLASDPAYEKAVQNLTKNSAAAPVSSWTYHSDDDALTGKTSFTACVTSTNKITQGFPYHDTDARFCIRRKTKSIDAFVQLNGDGQILCGIEGCGVEARFDQHPPRRFNGSGASDNSTNVIFLTPGRSVLAALKTSKVLLIGVTLYQNGSQTLSFDTSGLEWKVQ